MRKLTLFLLLFTICSKAQVTTTPNINLQVPAHGTPNWDSYLNADLLSIDSFLSGQTPLPGLTVTGNVGIGDINPGYPLWISRDIPNDTVAYFKNTDPNGYGLKVHAGANDSHYGLAVESAAGVNVITLSGNGVGLIPNITSSNLDNIIFVDGSTYACSDVGLTAAIATLPSNGGTVDAKGCIGAVTLSSVVRINKPGTTLILSGAATYTNTTGISSGQGMFSPEADNVTILGNNAKLSIVGSGRMGVRSLNSCANVTVRDLVITGSGVIGDAQEGIAFADSSQGWTFKHVQLIHNSISNTIIGIDLVNQDPVSTTEDVLVEGNKVFNIVGTSAGSGYGLISNNYNSSTNILRPMGLKIIGNHFENSSRHEVYTSMTSGVTVTGNTFLRHRSSVFTNADLAAVPIARVNNYVLADNVFDTCYDGCVDVDTDSALSPSGAIARSVSITGNVFRNSQWYDIILGTGSDPATNGFPDGVTITGNAFYKDSSQVPTLAFFIYLQSGKNITINSNSFYMKGLAASLIDFEANVETSGTSNALDRIAIRDNIFFADTAGATPFRWSATAAVSGVRADFTNNYVSIPSGNVFGFIAGQTNANIRVFNTPTSGLDLTKLAVLDGFVGQVSQTIGTGTVTTAGTAIASNSSQSNTMTITGATATDTAKCSLNAALPASWQTGIQVSIPIVTANTVSFWLSNPTAGSITPVAATVRCAVTR